MNNVPDKRGRLNEDTFSYQATKDGKVFISWCGKQVAILRGVKAGAFIEDIKDSEAKEAQMIMAKATGHFKHGNEKTNKRNK